MTIVKFKKRISITMYRQECFACCLMLYISMKFHENILKGFEVIEWTRNAHCQISKENNYKTV